MKIASNSGMMLLGIWLVLTGIGPLLHIDFKGMQDVINALAVGAGTLILMNR